MQDNSYVYTYYGPRGMFWATEPHWAPPGTPFFCHFSDWKSPKEGERVMWGHFHEKREFWHQQISDILFRLEVMAVWSWNSCASYFHHYNYSFFMLTILLSYHSLKSIWLPLLTHDIREKQEEGQWTGQELSLLRLSTWRWVQLIVTIFITIRRVSSRWWDIRLQSQESLDSCYRSPHHHHPSHHIQSRHPH